MFLEELSQVFFLFLYRIITALIKKSFSIFILEIMKLKHKTKNIDTSITSISTHYAVYY